MILLRLMFLLCVVLSPFNAAYGHALEPGYLDLRQLTDRSWQVFWRKPDVAGKPMAIDVRMPGSCVYPLDPAPKFDGAAWISAWVVDCPQGLVGKTVTLQGLEAQRTDVLVRYQPLDQTATTNRLTPTQNIFVASPEPTIIDVLASYFRLGFEHILEGWDHLLFVFALLILIRDIWRLIGAITAFTVAHSITLALAALGHVAIPGPPVEAIIALSIVFLAVELLKREEGRQRLSERAPWLIAFAFGLLHGLGFAGALREIGLPQSDIPTALIAFNLGVEAGQLAFVLAVLLVGQALRRVLPAITKNWQQIPGALNTCTGYAIGCMSTYWLVERVSSF